MIVLRDSGKVDVWLETMLEWAPTFSKPHDVAKHIAEVGTKQT